MTKYTFFRLSHYLLATTSMRPSNRIHQCDHLIVYINVAKGVRLSYDHVHDKGMA
jgi:hypothetical protein